MERTCRLCPSTSYRRVRKRNVDGAPLYRCSGCSVMFADPTTWLRIVPKVKEVPAEPPLPSLPPVPPPPAPVHGIIHPPPQKWIPPAGWTEADNQAIRQAAARANKSKPKR